MKTLCRTDNLDGSGPHAVTLTVISPAAVDKEPVRNSRAHCTFTEDILQKEFPSLN